MTNDEKLVASVAIVHYQTPRRSKLLSKCLQGLREQTEARFEIILLLDNPGVSLPKDIVDMLACFKYRLCQEEYQHGVAWGRKVVVECARAQYIAFIDDDAVPEPEWLSSMLNAVTCDGIVAVGGKTTSIPPKSRAEQFADIDGALRVPGRDAMGRIYNIPTVNACYNRNALLATSVIHPRYVIEAKNKRYHTFEDYDITQRLIKRFGHGALVTEETALVAHHHRRTIRASIRQSMVYGRGAGFWLNTYNQTSSTLHGNQRLPMNRSSFSRHLLAVVSALPDYRKHYLQARKHNRSLMFALNFALYGWLLRTAFHWGVWSSTKALSRQTLASLCI